MTAPTGQLESSADERAIIGMPVWHPREGELVKAFCNECCDSERAVLPSRPEGFQPDWDNAWSRCGVRWASFSVGEALQHRLEVHGHAASSDDGRLW